MLKLENISKYYYSSSSITCALRKINLEFNIGEFVAIIGESGSGKTTLLNLISGLDSYEEGELYVNGKQTSYFDSNDWERYRKDEIAFIFQNYNLIDSFTVLDNVVVTYLIEGFSYKESKRKAKEKLKLVGLENHLYKRAAKLSGGQKQRLSIARALAKETNIIIADEPTGNLDAENGLSVLSLLKKLSKDKLVIVVTHNQSQIEPFCTRKIRLHDGEVVQDQKVCEVESNSITIKEEKQKSNFKSIFDFSFLNIKSQPRKSILVFILILICVFTTFIFLGNFKMNLDENKTKDVETSIFLNLDETRMLVKKNDNSIITNDILQEARVKNVLSVERYDYITDVNYYRLGDYRTIYDGGFVDTPDKMDTNFVDMSSIDFINHSKYMRSSSSLTSDMLKAGRLPENAFEMVLYEDDLSLLNTVEQVYFRNAKLWGEDSSYNFDIKIVGILKEPTKQVYFSDLICKIMDLTRYKFQIQVYYKIKTKQQIITFKNVVFDPNLPTGYNLSFDENSLGKLTSSDVSFYESYNTITNIKGEKETNKYKLQLNKALNNSSLSNTLGVSLEIFEKIYDNYKDKTQFAVFVSDYVNIDQVSSDLINKGFSTLSCFKASVTGYNHKKVVNQYINLTISIVAMIVINLLTVLVGYSILRVKKNDYIIFKMIGLENKTSSKINHLEISFYTLLANVCLIIASVIIQNTVKEQLIVDLFKRIKWYDYLIVLCVTVVTTIILGHKFNKYIKKSAKVTVLKEE